MCKALAKRFTNLIDYAQPAEFWNKYRISKVADTNGKSKNVKKRNISKKKKRKSRKVTDDEDDSNDDVESANEDDDDEYVEHEDKNNQRKYSDESDLNDSDEDNEPLVKRRKIKSGISCGELPMDYIFKPNI